MAGTLYGWYAAAVPESKHRSHRWLKDVGACVRIAVDPLGVGLVLGCRGTRRKAHPLRVPYVELTCLGEGTMERGGGCHGCPQGSTDTRWS